MLQYSANIDSNIKYGHDLSQFGLIAGKLAKIPNLFLQVLLFPFVSIIWFLTQIVTFALMSFVVSRLKKTFSQKEDINKDNYMSFIKEYNALSKLLDGKLMSILDQKLPWYDRIAVHSIKKFIKLLSIRRDSLKAQIASNDSSSDLVENTSFRVIPQEEIWQNRTEAYQYLV